MFQRTQQVQLATRARGRHVQQAAILIPHFLSFEMLQIVIDPILFFTGLLDRREQYLAIGSFLPEQQRRVVLSRRVV